jgi:nicotinamide phosphoribosyltransferase
MLHKEKLNFILRTDSYKVTHWKQNPPGTEFVHSYLCSRGGMFPSTVFFGLQYYLQEYLKGTVLDEQDVNEAKMFYKQHFGRDLFNWQGWMNVARLLDGRLPVEIRAVREGSLVTNGNALMTIENTDARFPWMTQYIESLLLKVWYPITVATLSHNMRQMFLSALHRTGTPSLLDFKVHDFGYRGVSSEETAAIGGASHMLNFRGTDNVPALAFLRKFYQGSMEGFSVPAAEHSTITSWGGPEHEVEAFENMLTQFPEGIVAVVSDSYDIYKACREKWGEVLKQKVLERDGVLVVRPDSGDPKAVVLQVLDILGEKFGWETNRKGYRVLCPKVRVIQGDGVNYWTMQDTLTAMSKAGWSADNLTFGIGGALLQQLNRDTQQMAIKVSNVTVNGVDRDVYKNPVGDSGKASRAGRLALHNCGGIWTTAKKTANIGDPDDLLVPVFRNGTILQTQSIDDVRATLNG